MIVTRKCHRCGKKNRFDKSNIEGPVVCARCGGRIRRTEQNLSFPRWVLLNIKGYIVYHKWVLFVGVLVAAFLGAGVYYWADLASKESQEVVDQTPAPEVITEPWSAAEPVKPEPPKPVRAREPRRFEAEPVWTKADVAPAFSVPAGSTCLLYTSPSPRDKRQSRMPSSA